MLHRFKLIACNAFLCYNSPGVILEDCEFVTLIAGGVGVTPIASMLGDLYNTISRGVRDKQSFTVRYVAIAYIHHLSW
jgi:hypothetical protein